MYQGPQVHRNQMIITAANDDLDVYYQPDQNTVVSLATEHTIPANTLENGKQYQARIRVAPKDGQWSEWSEPVKFWCFGDPTFRFVLDGQDVYPGTASMPGVRSINSSFAINLSYYQAQREGLKSFKVDLYGSDGRKILEGQERYDVGDIRYDTNNLGVTIRGLEDNHIYSIQATGETDHGMIVQTERVYITVDYEHPATFSLIEVENMPDEALIRISSNLTYFEGYSNMSPVRYVNNERVDLTAYGAYVIFDQGFNLDGDFTLHLVGENLHAYSEILTIQNGDYEITLTYMRGWYDADMREQAYLVLSVKNATGSYEQVSNFLNVPYFDDKVHIYIRRKGGLYDLNWCVCEDGSHVVLNPKEFDVQLRTTEEWNAVKVEGYRNLPENRLEF